MWTSTHRVLVFAVTALCAGCATIPDNAVQVTFESTPSRAAVFLPNGKMLGVTPHTMVVPLSTAVVANTEVGLGSVRVEWASGATTESRLFVTRAPGGKWGGSHSFMFGRPQGVPGLMQDIRFAEEQSRKESADAAEGWAVLGDIVNKRNQQRAALPSLDMPRQSAKPIECVSRSTLGIGNPVVTTCK